MTFSIVIPNYNSEKYIKRCLDSILSQRFKDYEVIIVDDMSTDCSVDMIKMYIEEYYSVIKLIELDEKKYNGGTRNIGVSKAKGDYILFLDCDDYLYSNDSLREIYKKIIETRADLIRLSYVAEKGLRKCRMKLREKNLDELANTVFVAPWTKCIKKDLFVPFPENTLLEDIVQHIAQIDNIKNFAICSEPYAVWNRNNDDAISSDKAKYDKDSKRYSSVYRNMADLLDLRCKHDYCEKQRQFRIRNYEDIIRKDEILDLINGDDTK